MIGKWRGLLRAAALYRLLALQQEAEAGADRGNAQRQRRGEGGAFGGEGDDGVGRAIDVGEPAQPVVVLVVDDVGLRDQLAIVALGIDPPALLDERLRPLKAPEALVGLLRELFQTCNQARYAPQSTNEELVSLVPKVESALNELKKLKA